MAELLTNTKIGVTTIAQGGAVSVTLPATAGTIALTTQVAPSVANAFVIKENTGTTEGTDLYTFNGSGAKTINLMNGTNIDIVGTAGVITINGPAFATGTTNGTWNYTPNGGSATAVAVFGLGTAAYTASTAYEGVSTSSSSTTHYWKKFADGTLIKYGTYSATFAVSTPWSSSFVSPAQTLTFNTTIPFTTAPAVSLTFNNASSYTLFMGSATISTTAMVWQVTRPVTLAPQTFTVSYMAIGRG
jgi:hypothetical protein